MNTYSFRLKPGQDLFDEIEAYVMANHIEAGVILCAVGSLSEAVLRMAGHDDYARTTGKFEIVAAAGTVSIHGSHIHLGVADDEGRTTGGHLAAGCKVRTTAEIVLGTLPGVVYRRELCELSGYAELVVDSSSMGRTQRSADG